MVYNTVRSRVTFQVSDVSFEKFSKTFQEYIQTIHLITNFLQKTLPKQKFNHYFLKKTQQDNNVNCKTVSTIITRKKMKEQEARDEK